MRAGVWLCQRCVFDEDEQHVCGSVAMDGICARCGRLAREVFLGECQDPRPASDAYGERFFTSCTDIVLYTQCVWDVNCYYRDLGVAMDATRREIGEAYRTAQGWTSARLTYIVKQLLDPVTRALYDSCRPGTLFMDRYIMEEIDRRIEEDLARHYATGGTREDTERIDLSHLANKPFEVIDKRQREEQDVVHRGWGFYLWQSGERSRAKLAGWQEHLIRAFAERGETQHIAVGFCGRHMDTVEVIREGNRPIIFLNEREQPSIALAREAVDRVDNHTRADDPSLVTL